MCPLRPDIQYATKELTRAEQKPDGFDQHDTSARAIKEDYIIKAENADDVTEIIRLQYFGEEAAKYDVNNDNEYEYDNLNNEYDIKNDFTKLLQYFRQ
eukprot:1798874-Amphidinium_carterae.1